MKPISPRKLLQFHNLVKREQRRGLKVTVTGPIVTLIDPVGGIHSADLRDDPEMSSPVFMSYFMLETFQDYVMRHLAPCGYQRQNAHEFLWDESAYAFMVGMYRSNNGEYCVSVMAGGGTGRPLGDSSYEVRYAAWPSPVELNLLKPRAIAEFERLKRFELFLTKEKITYGLSKYGTEISPLSISFENGKPKLRFIGIFTIGITSL